MSDNIESQAGQQAVIKPTNPPFYIPNKILSIKDINGKDPPIRICEGNRTAGKTFGFKHKLLKNFDEDGRKFTVIRRYKNQVKGVSEYFAKDIFEVDERLARHKLTQRPLFDGQMAELRFGGAPCGYVVPLSARGLSKEASSIFVDVYQNFFDEFQAEDGRYAPDEFNAFQTILGSIARGGGKQSRYVQTIMCANSVSIFNPYYIAYGIDKRLTSRTKFLRGDGWVLERVYNQAAAIAYAEAHRDAKDTKMFKYACGNDYLLDKYEFVQKLPGQKSLMFVLKRNGDYFGVWNAGNLIYISRKFDPGYNRVVTMNVDDHAEGDILVPNSSIFCKTLMNAYMAGAVRFDSAQARMAYISCVSQLQSKA